MVMVHNSGPSGKATPTGKAKYAAMEATCGLYEYRRQNAPPVPAKRKSKTSKLSSIINVVSSKDPSSKHDRTMLSV